MLIIQAAVSTVAVGLFVLLLLVRAAAPKTNALLVPRGWPSTAWLAAQAIASSALKRTAQPASLTAIAAVMPRLTASWQVQRYIRSLSLSLSLCMRHDGVD
jgi:hypothetical protein